MAYNPPKEILDKYADVLVNFALNSGEGVKKGEVVLLRVGEIAKPLLKSLRKSLLNAGAHPIIHYFPDDFDREFYELAQDHHIEFFPDKYIRGLVDQIDHIITILAETNPKELEGIEPKKIMKRGLTYKPYMDWRHEKEAQGKLTWVLALYGTEAQAKEAGLSLEEYWSQIINACFLDHENPIEKWQGVFTENERVRTKLNSREC